MLLPMSRKELDRVQVMQDLEQKRVTQCRAAELLGVSERQVRRLLRRFERAGPEGLIHRSRGRPSNRRMAEKVRATAVAMMREEGLSDYGPTLLSETMAEETGLRLSNEGMRQLMIAEGCWHPRKAKVRHHAWRERKACFGEMVQMDTSIHDWLEGRGQEVVLIAMIDDATSELFCRFYPTDSTATNMACLRDYIRRYGRPRALYVDKASHFMTSREATAEEQRAGKHAQTQIQRALEELKIEHITAHSPQAKGRVERCFKTLQDRLVKGMRRAGIATMDEANAYLEQVFLPKWKARFTCEAKEEANAHRPRKGFNLNAILSHQETRCVADDYTFSYRAAKYQIQKRSVAAGLRRSRVTIEERLDGTRKVRWRGHYLRWQPLPEHAHRPVSNKAAPATPGKKTKHKPAANHPWRKKCLPSRPGKEEAA